jgi:cytochrome P450
MAKPVAPPTLPGHPVLGSWADALGDPLGLCSRAFCALGDVARIRGIAPTGWIQVSHPDGVEQVLDLNAAAYRAPTSGLAASLFGRGLVRAESDSWLSRRLAAPILDAERLSVVVGSTAAAAGEVADGWGAAGGEGRTVDMVVEMRRLAARATCAAVLSLEPGAESDAFGASLRGALYHLDRRPTTLSAPGLSSRRNWRALHARGVFDAVLGQLIRQRRASGRAHPDLLGALLRARDAATGERMSDAALQEELFALLLAGADTAATTLAWCWELLSRHADALEALQAEADEVLGSRAALPDDLPRLPFARAVVDETLRLFPPSWGLPREAVAADEIAGYAIPAGSLVVLCRWVTHRRADFWEEPARFDPWRFLGERAGAIAPFAYDPFGGEERGPAAQLAVAITQVALATLARDFDVAAPLESRVLPDASFTLRPRVPLRVHAGHRFAAPASPPEDAPGGQVLVLSRGAGELDADPARVCVVA